MSQLFEAVPKRREGADLTGVNIDPMAAYLFSRIDGISTVSHLSHMVPFEPEQVLAIVELLADAGLVALPGYTPQQQVTQASNASLQDAVLAVLSGDETGLDSESESDRAMNEPDASTAEKSQSKTADNPFDVDFSAELQRKAAANPQSAVKKTVRGVVEKNEVVPTASIDSVSTASQVAEKRPEGTEAKTPQAHAKEVIRAARAKEPSPAKKARDADKRGQEFLKKLEELERKLEYADYFRLLDIGRIASDDDVRNAFHKLSRTFHPDRIPRAIVRPTVKMRVTVAYAAIQEAYALLRDEKARKQYAADQRRATLAKASKEKEPDAPAPKITNLASGDNLVATALEEVARGNFKPAMTNLKLASQMNRGDLRYKELIKQVKVLEAIDKGTERADADTLFDAQLDELAKAIAAAREFLGEFPRQLRKATGFLLQHRKDYAAVRDLVHRLPSAKLTADDLKMLAGAHAGMSQYNSAVECLERASKMEPQDQELKKEIKALRKKL